MGLKEDRQQEEGKERKFTHHSCATDRGTGGIAGSALLQQGQASQASKIAGLQKLSLSRRKSRTIWEQGLCWELPVARHVGVALE